MKSDAEFTGDESMYAGDSPKSDLRSADDLRTTTEQLHATMAALEERTAAAESARSAAEAAQRAANSANRAKSEFLAMMSHEFRTPLNAMVGYAQLLDVGLAGPLNEQQRGYLDRLAASTKHLLGLVTDVLDLSRIEAGGARVLREEATTAPATSAAIDLADPGAAARDVRLVDVCPEGVPYVGDEHRVRQILLNLLSNAVKFSRRGDTVTVRCDIATEAPSGSTLSGPGPWAYIRVEDSGVGIPPEEQDRIFQPFHQVETGRTRKQDGTGLGLAISRQLAQLMGGDLTVESTLGVGSAFTLWLASPARSAGMESHPDPARNSGAQPTVGTVAVPGLSDIGEHLNDSIAPIIKAYGERLRADPDIPEAREMRSVLLEDHAVSLLADLAQSLVIVAEAGRQAADLLRDGSTIQRAIAEAHGARRFAQGWSEQSVRRDHWIFREEVQAAARAGATRNVSEAEAAFRVLATLNERAEGISLRSWRRCSEAAASQDKRSA